MHSSSESWILSIFFHIMPLVYHCSSLNLSFSVRDAFKKMRERAVLWLSALAWSHGVSSGKCLLGTTAALSSIRSAPKPALMWLLEQGINWFFPLPNLPWLFPEHDSSSSLGRETLSHAGENKYNPQLQVAKQLHSRGVYWEKGHWNRDFLPYLQRAKNSLCHQSGPHSPEYPKVT